jgi:hypothetical protein
MLGGDGPRPLAATMRGVAAGLLGLWLIGCAPTFSRPATAPSQYAVDLAECRQQQAHVPAGPTWGGVAGLMLMIDYAQRRDRVLVDCMTARGWAKDP